MKIDSVKPPAIRLFKYFSVERLDVLRTNRIRFTPPAELNDPFELVPRVPVSEAEFGEMADEILNKEYALQPLINPTARPIPYTEWWKGIAKSMRPKLISDLRAYFSEFLDIFPRHLQIHLSEKCGVLCLSENIESLLMWAHYTNGHTGFALEFDSEKELFTRKRLPVCYHEERPVWRKDDPGNLSILRSKSPEWTYEREHRVIRAFSELDEAPLTSGKMGHFAQLREDAIKGVYVGCRMQQQHIEELLNILARPTYQHVEVFVALPSPDRFNLSFLPPGQIQLVSKSVSSTLSRIFGKDYSGIRRSARKE